jgi:competence protein ComEC
MKKYLLIAGILIFLLGGIFLYQDITFNDKKLHVVVCDVGQGDAIFMRTPGGSDILIDGGPDNSVLSCLSRHMPIWDRTIEIMILTHPHADHLTGLIDVLSRYRVITFGMGKTESSTDIYKELVKQLKQNGTVQNYMYQGDRFVIRDGVVLTTLWPTREWIDQNPATKSSDENGSSVIEFLNYGNFKALFTADAQVSDMEKIDLLAGKIDLLKVPHHGSKTGLNQDVLGVLLPKIAAISVGAKNKYGHPNPFILDLLTQFKIKTLRTDQVRDIEIVSDGNGFLQKIN